MRTRMMLALILAAVAVGPASGQDADRGGIRTETMTRMANEGSDVPWDLIGLLGLLGLIGLVRPHGEDSYHPASVE